MTDEAFDMESMSGSPAATPEPAQPEAAAEPTTEVAEQSATPEAEAPAPEEGTRSAKRIRELLAERDRYRELASLVSNQPQVSNNPKPLTSQATGEETDLEQVVRDVAAKVNDIQRANMEQAVERKLQAAEREIDLVKSQFTDFNEYLPEVREILDRNKSLRSSANPIRDAYFMAKGMTAAQAVQAAKDAGRQEAYQTIAQKGQSAVTAGGSPRPSVNPDQNLLEKYRSGQLSDAERKAYWPKIVNAMSAE